MLSGRSAICDGPFGSKLKTDHYRTSGTRVVRLQNIGLDEFIDKDKAYIDDDYAATLMAHSYAPSDVIVASLGEGVRPAGRACLVPQDVQPGIVKADCFRVRTDLKLLVPEFLAAFLSSPKSLRELADVMRGATRPRVTLDMLRTHRVPAPDIAIQKGIVAHLRKARTGVANLAATLAEERKTHSALTATLLRDAFAGRL